MMLTRILTVDIKKLAHCRMCCEPMYCIYDQSVRDYCHDCAQEAEEETEAAAVVLN